MRPTLTESLIRTLELVEAGILDADPRFNRENFDELLKICNACGAKGSRLPIPQTAWGMDIRPMCHIHDTDYHWGETNEDKEHGDRRMKHNGHRLVRKFSVWFLKHPRRLRILGYYFTVYNLGGEAFWDGKMESKE